MNELCKQHFHVHNIYLISISENHWYWNGSSEYPVATANQQMNRPSTSATSGHVQPQQPGLQGKSWQ